MYALCRRRGTGRIILGSGDSGFLAGEWGRGAMRLCLPKRDIWKQLFAESLSLCSDRPEAFSEVAEKQNNMNR